MTSPPTSDLPGHKRLAERVNLALDTCVESQGVEFKGSNPWKTLMGGIIKTACAMGNLRDGGIIVIGVSQRVDTWEPTGVTEEELKTYDVDKIVDQVNSHISPHVDLTIVTHTRDDKTFLVIHVAPFRDTPLVCKKDHAKEAFAGTLYIRPAGKPESRKVLNASEMHELLERAAEIRAREFLEKLKRMNLLPGSSGQERFKEELEGL
jgi:predicted HTH transcriptional regulator